MLTQRTAAPYFISHAPGKGTIARYDSDQPIIDRQLADIRTATDGISLSLWLWKGIGINDEFLDWSNGALAPQIQTNFTNLLKTIKHLGFTWVQIAVEFWGPNDPRGNPFTEAMYGENWNFIASLPAQLDAAGLDYIIDVCPEVNDVYKTNPGLQRYAKRLWVDVTCWFYPNGRPCWKFSMSFIPGANLDVLADVFQGNVPVILIPHCYSKSQQQVYDGLKALGLGGHPWLAGEDFTLCLSGDSIYAQGWVGFIEVTKQPLVAFCPWPITTAWKEGDSSITVCPVGSLTVWRGVGA